MLLISCTTTDTPTPATSTPAPATSTPDQSVTANWWDKFGEPQYGGTLRALRTTMSPSWDQTFPMGSDVVTLTGEHLFQASWTTDPDEFSLSSGFVPVEYMEGLVAESWEQQDPQTFIVKIREGIHFQNKAPVNGRELTADDVKYSYDRLLGTGSGFTEPNPSWTRVFDGVQEINVLDDYTVEFKFNRSGAMLVYQLLAGQNQSPVVIIPHEWVEQGDTQNWENSTGSGPWILSDYQDGVHITYTKNPDYWGYDQRHPENKIPYLDELRYVIIPDMVTALTAMRTEQLDVIAVTPGGPSMLQGVSMAESNPEINIAWWPDAGFTLDMRCDLEPFNDIKVRKALQMAIDNEAITASVYRGIVDPYPAGIISPTMTGWTLPYEEWPEDLKAEYTYNTEGARALLAEAGYPDGFETNIILQSGSIFTEVLEICKAYFLDIGVDMEIVPMDQASMTTYLVAGKHDAMAATTRTAIPLPPDNVLLFRGSTFPSNYTHNNDTYYDELTTKVFEAADIEAAMQASVEADMYLIGQHWSVQTPPIAAPVMWQPWVIGYEGEHWRGAGWYARIPTRIWIEQ